MLYLNSVKFPSDGVEFDFLISEKRQCYNTFYPFKVLSGIDMERMDFEPITFLYGGNGSGKTTALNIIAEKAGLHRETIYNRSSFYEDYLNLCEIDTTINIPKHSRIITSDDVFDYILNVRAMNEGIDRKRVDMFDAYLEHKYAHFKMRTLEDYEQLKQINEARRRTQSQYVKHNLMDNIRELSNGESAFKYFTEGIQENGLYLLDEPENSLSPKRQRELVRFIEDSVRFYGCQFIIATHSPFLLSMKHAKIYDFDQRPATTKMWTELENIKALYELFMEHRAHFE